MSPGRVLLLHVIGIHVQINLDIAADYSQIGQAAQDYMAQLYLYHTCTHL